jgi:hypothetical protein
VVRVRLDRKATSISLLVVLGIREDGQKVLLGESTEAYRRDSSYSQRQDLWGGVVRR